MSKNEQLSNAAPGGQWDEPQLQSALTLLQEMHVHLRQLRDTVPSILRPIHAEPSSPETLFAEFHKAATGAVNNVKHFKALIQDQDSQQVLLTARESKAKNADGIQNWLVSQHADWLDVPLVRGAKELKIEEEEKESTPVEIANDSVSSVVQAFKELNTSPEINVNEERRIITMQMPAPTKLSFVITWDARSAPARTYKVVVKGASKLHNSINQALAKRPHPNDLKQTLETVVAYADVRTARCDKCNKLLDVEGQFAVVKIRKRPPPPPDNTQPKDHWQSFHPGCS